MLTRGDDPASFREFQYYSHVLSRDKRPEKEIQQWKQKGSNMFAGDRRNHKKNVHLWNMEKRFSPGASRRNAAL